MLLSLPPSLNTWRGREMRRERVQYSTPTQFYADSGVFFISLPEENPHGKTWYNATKNRPKFYYSGREESAMCSHILMRTWVCQRTTEWPKLEGKGDSRDSILKGTCMMTHNITFLSLFFLSLRICARDLIHSLCRYPFWCFPSLKG